MGSLFAEYNVPPVYHLSIIAMVIITGTFIVYPHLLVSTRTEQQVEKAPLITLPKGRLWIAGSIAAISVFIEGAMSDWAALYLKDMQAPDSVAAIGLACFTGAMAFGRLLGDRYINYWGSIRSIQIASWFTILGLFFSLLTYLPTVAILGFIITGLGVSIMFPCKFGYKIKANWHVSVWSNCCGIHDGIYFFISWSACDWFYSSYRWLTFLFLYPSYCQHHAYCNSLFCQIKLIKC